MVYLLYFNSYQLPVISYQFHPQGLSPPLRAPKALVAGLNPPPARWRHWSLFTVLISIYWQKLAIYANNANGNS
ncbi:hypothetical protein SAMD00079811_64230 [Scytonema sp. HK-05]|uniref:hypothetical protein n=1 Tax=Scytonema sp. HK-05 TaxID=1137095 RepID=UPI000936F48A|nr:hypothetical protein [Scytonema sp. HK-05]OKH59033.1 hypothetical protein NIES2130_10765 [Scytonema sp. HK-05]BAY48797.1 hypothetical protein SAMD00079811_64230 [Scytonema sp. HK-05]